MAAQITTEASTQFDAREFRRALGCFPTGVAIITTRDTDGTPVGLTCNSFSSVSLEPPLVQWSLRSNSRSLDAFRRAGKFAINVLAEDQSEISSHFASNAADKFEGRDHSGKGLPTVDGCIARFVCKTAAEYEAGDHIMFLGEVESFEHQEQAPLVFYRGAYKIIAESLANLGHTGELTATHINEAREHVYGTLFRLACERATPEDLQRIEAKLDEIDQHLLSGEMELRAKSALDLFETIGLAAHSPVLTMVAHSLGEVMKKQISASATKRDWASLHKSDLTPIRRRILERIRQKDPEGAVEALAEYISLSPVQNWA